MKKVKAKLQIRIDLMEEAVTDCKNKYEEESEKGRAHDKDIGEREQWVYSCVKTSLQLIEDETRESLRYYCTPEAIRLHLGAYGGAGSEKERTGKRIETLRKIICNLDNYLE